jgi:DNA-binding XRE family transcriptional regulator
MRKEILLSLNKAAWSVSSDSEPGDPRPEWAKKIELLRRSLGTSQAALARKLEVSPMAVCRWERAVNEPTAQNWIALGKLVEGWDTWFCWERAGLDLRLVLDVLAASQNTAADEEHGRSGTPSSPPTAA